MKVKKNEVYESPQIEVIEFELEDSIAASGNAGPSLTCGDESYGGM